MSQALKILTRLLILAMKIYNWANSFLIGHDYLIRAITNDSLPNIRIYKSHLVHDEDITRKYILYGYAIFTGGNNSTNYKDYMDDQNTARNNKRGIWSLEWSVLSKLGNWDISPKPLKITYETESKSNYHELKPVSNIKTEMPYLPLLAVSFASFALAWDYLATASDYQNIIDRMSKQITDLNNTLNNMSPYDATIPAINQSIKNAQDIVNDAQKTKTRKIIFGVSCIAVGIITTIFSLKEVQVRTDLQSLTLSYRF
jgi:hypothetical protein